MFAMTIEHVSFTSSLGPALTVNASSKRMSFMFYVKEVMVQITSMLTLANVTRESFLLHSALRQSVLSEFVLPRGKIYSANQARRRAKHRAWPLLILYYNPLF